MDSYIIPWQLIPMQYQGWAFLVFMFASFIAMLYAFYLIATSTPKVIPKVKQPKSRGKT